MLCRARLTEGQAHQIPGPALKVGSSFSPGLWVAKCVTKSLCWPRIKIDTYCTSSQISLMEWASAFQCYETMPNCPHYSPLLPSPASSLAVKPQSRYTLKYHLDTSYTSQHISYITKAAVPNSSKHSQTTITPETCYVCLPKSLALLILSQSSLVPGIHDWISLLVSILRSY